MKDLKFVDFFDCEDFKFENLWLIVFGKLNQIEFIGVNLLRKYLQQTEEIESIEAENETEASFY